MQFEQRPPDGLYGSVFVPFLNEEFEIRVWPESESTSEPNSDTSIDTSVQPTQHQLMVVRQILRLPTEFLNQLDEAAESYRRLVDETIDLSKYDLGHINRANIREHYRIHTIMIPVHADCTDTCFLIGCGCDWEDEHGMEFRFRNQKLVFCGEEECRYNCNFW